MKYFIAFIFLINANTTFAQSTWNPTKEQKEMYLAGQTDRIPIQKQDIEKYYNYAKQLAKKDSLMKAGMIMHRIFLIDSISVTGQKAFVEREKIKNRLTGEIKKQLAGKWNKIKCSESADGDADAETITIYADEMITNGNKIKEKSFPYKALIDFDWFGGFFTIQMVSEKQALKLLHFHVSPDGHILFSQFMIEENITDAGKADVNCFARAL